MLEHFEPEEASRTLRALVSWAVRGLIVGGIGGGVAERAYAQAAQRVREAGVTTADDVLRQLLPIVPADEDFISAFSRARVSRPAVGRYLLLSLERRKREIEAAELLDPTFEEGMRLQHIVPRDAEVEEWPSFDDEDRLKQSISRIGNFVLLARGEPALTGATTFSARKAVFDESSVRLTREVAELDDWTPFALADRQQALAELAAELWPRSPS